MTGRSSDNLLLTGLEIFPRQVKHVKNLMVYPFSHGATQSAVILVIFIPLKLLAKTLPSPYDFAENIVMLIGITISKRHNIYDSV